MIRTWFLIGLSCSIALFARSDGAPLRPNDSPDWQHQLDSLRLQVSNFDAELHILAEKLNSQSDTTDALQQQIEATRNMQRGSYEGHLSQVEHTTSSLINDLKILKDHTNDLSAALTSQNQKIVSLEKNINDIQAALKSIMEALDIPSTTASGPEIDYKVKNGDSLEKIARKHNTTVKALKDLNHLSNDRIIVGQKLKIPNSHE